MNVCTAFIDSLGHADAPPRLARLDMRGGLGEDAATALAAAYIDTKFDSPSL